MTPDEATAPAGGTAPEDELILVDAHDREVGHATKTQCHRHPGLRHRAFSIYLFDSTGAFLLHRRSAQKPLWAGAWTNSCCSHPRRGEATDAAASRRLEEELGTTTELSRHFRFEYRASDGPRGVEHEVVSVFTGTVERTSVEPNPNEIDAVRWIDPDSLDREMANAPSPFTPWFRMAWPTVRALR